MFDGGNDSDQHLELQRRGLELATQEAEERRTEINAILSSRRVLRSAEQDPSVRDTRLAILEELAHVSYPGATVLAAARHLASRSGRRRITRRQRVLAGVAALALCVVGGASALGVALSSRAPIDHAIIPTHVLRANARERVPNVVGSSAGQASAVLQAAGLATSVTCGASCPVSGVVVRQEPVANSIVAPRTRVAIVVGSTSTPRPLSPSTTIAPPAGA